MVGLMRYAHRMVKTSDAGRETANPLHAIMASELGLNPKLAKGPVCCMISVKLPDEETELSHTTVGS